MWVDWLRCLWRHKQAPDPASPRDLAIEEFAAAWREFSAFVDEVNQPRGQSTEDRKPADFAEALAPLPEWIEKAGRITKGHGKE
jgi:hypothetical protein